MSTPQLPLALRGRMVSESTGRTAAANSSSSSDLEYALPQLVQEHQVKSMIIRDKTEKAKKEAIRKASRASDLMVEAVNGGVQNSFIEQKRIEMEIRSLSATVSRYKKQTDQWLAVSHAINGAVKEIGDFENWMKVMAFDCKTIHAAIRNIHQE